MTDYPEGNEPNKSMAKSFHRPLGNRVELIGSGFAARLTSLKPTTGFANFSASLLIPGHHTFDRYLCFILTIPGCTVMPNSSETKIIHANNVDNLHTLSETMTRSKASMVLDETSPFLESPGQFSGP